MKELHTGADYWNTFSTGTTQWPSVSEPYSTKVLIIGGGISGLLTAFMLHEQNIEYILIEAKNIAGGSSLASTGLLQYCSDLMLHELRKAIGKQKADLFYISCYHAVDEIRRIADILKDEVGDVQLHTRESMQYCSNLNDIDKLKKEYAALTSLNLPCELWDDKSIELHFPFSKRLALVTQQDAEINPHLFVVRLAQFLSKHGAHIFEHSKATAMHQRNNGTFSTVVNECMIEAEYVIHAVGYHYEQLPLSELKVKVNRSYVIVTEPIDDLSSWHQRMLIWETARPYLYMRTTPDCRIIIGGLDEASTILNQNARSLHKHNDKLLLELNKLFPSIQTNVDFAWNAYFIEPKDGLPYIGASKQNKHHLYIQGYGGNGTVCSMLGAQLVSAAIAGSLNTSQQELATFLTPSRV